MGHDHQRRVDGCEYGRESVDLHRYRQFDQRVRKRLPALLFKDLNVLRATGTEAEVIGSGKGAALVRSVSRLFPDAWTLAADRFGPLYARGTSGRAWQSTFPSSVGGRRYSFKGFKFVAQGNDGLVAVDSFASAVHEYVHRLQHALPGLDDYFQDVHQRRTAGDPLKRIRDLLPGHGYPGSEVTREDKYVHPYQGKIYSGGNRYLGKHGALEVMSVAFENVLGGNRTALEMMVRDDREMFDLVIGALYYYVP